MAGAKISMVGGETLHLVRAEGWATLVDKRHDLVFMRLTPNRGAALLKKWFRGRRATAARWKRLLGRLGGGMGSSTVGRAAASQWLLDGIRDGQVVVYRRLRGDSDDAAAPTVEAEPPPRHIRRVEEEAATHWIEIVLLDYDDEPVAGQPYELVTPDGKTISGRLDGAGCAYVDLDVGGECKVAFLGLDG